MTHMRTGLLALFAVLAATAATAAPAVPEATVEPLQTVEPAARKGTRSYRDGEATPTVPAATTPAARGDFSEAEKLAQCMDTWDKGTHITKSKWRDICKRQLDAR